jgi:hypothetical protein
MPSMSSPPPFFLRTYPRFKELQLVQTDTLDAMRGSFDDRSGSWHGQTGSVLAIKIPPEFLPVDVKHPKPGKMRFPATTTSDSVNPPRDFGQESARLVLIHDRRARAPDASLNQWVAETIVDDTPRLVPSVSTS